LSEILWKTLVYHGEVFEKFEASTDGRIRNSKTLKIYKTCINKNGYEQVCVSIGSSNKKKVFKIHRAIAETFIPNPKNKPEVNHKDGNKLNNYMLNLEWSTGSENMQHAAKTGLLHPKRGVDNSWAKLSTEDVDYIREHYIPYDLVYGARALGRKFNVNKNTIVAVAKGVAYVNV
jgi:hypothetical protein